MLPWGDCHADNITDCVSRAGHRAFCTGRSRHCGKIPHGPRGRAAARPRAGMPPCVIHQQQPNDAFWFRHDKDKGKVLQVWYNPNARCVERKSWETEFFAAVLAVIGAALLLIR